MTNTISKIDLQHYKKIRNNVSEFLKHCAKKYDKKGLLLDIAPQVHEGAHAYFAMATLETLDIDPTSGATYILDLCENNSEVIANNTFDFIVCTEVLEHTLQPFEAVKEMYRILKPLGYLFLSTPFDFRVHGPRPDCWRFTEDGLRALLKSYNIIALSPLENKNRWLMPTHYTVVAQKV